MEGALTADLAQPEARGTAYGMLGAVNGLGDFLASVVVGILWASVSPALAFGYGAAAMLAGSIFVASLKLR